LVMRRESRFGPAMAGKPLQACISPVCVTPATLSSSSLSVGSI
jgi:hypothetical protein